MTVQLFKLINGDEIIGYLDHETEKLSIIRKPLMLNFEKDYKSGVVGIVLLNYIPFADSDFVEIANDKIVIKMDIDNVMMEYYEKSVYYNKNYHDKKLKQSIIYAVDQLDKLIEEYVDKKPKKSYSKDLIEKIILSNSIPGSNTVN